MNEPCVTISAAFGRSRTPWRLFGVVTASGLILTLMCSCMSVTYDMRQLQQPVTLNANPFLMSTNLSSPELTDVDRYTAEVSELQIVASSGSGNSTTTTTTRKVANQAQVNAFAKIGGQQNRAIRNVSLATDHLAINGLFVLSEQVSIKAAGDVVEFHVPAVPAATANAAGLTNNPVAEPRTIPATGGTHP